MTGVQTCALPIYGLYIVFVNKFNNFSHTTRIRFAIRIDTFNTYLSQTVIEGLSLLVFLASDVLLFYVMFEATLIPMYFMISGFGGPERAATAVKFLLFTQHFHELFRGFNHNKPLQILRF